ncbi:MAG TPA: VWA domain-containing protein [Vicinamibacterales bacterium]|nr:VWA domain-containing protein [Vicinamibacterales bacterium]
MAFRFRRAACVFVLVVAASVPPGAAAKLQTRHVFVHVIDQQGAPVSDLAASDFQLTEGGVPRVVTHAGPATDPMRIALFLDTSDAAAPALTHMRAGAVAFLDALPPEDDVLIVTTGRQVRVRVQPTTDRRKLKDAAGGLFTDGAGTVLMDGLMEIDERFFKKAEDRWPVFVIFTSDGTESSAGAREKEFNTWQLAIGTRGVTAHALLLKAGKGGGTPEVVANNLTRNTGGRYDVMNTTNALPAKMKALAEQLALDHRRMEAWYQIDFQTDSTEFKPIDVGVARSGVRLEISDRRKIQ